MNDMISVLQIAGALLGIPLLTFIGGGGVFAVLYIVFGPKPNQPNRRNRLSKEFAGQAGSIFGLFIGAPIAFMIGIDVCRHHLPIAYDRGWPVFYGCVLAIAVWAVMTLLTFVPLRPDDDD
ncbi:MAG TPA: hypothetical protein V6C69_20625 [Trichormus sp.]|jgi:hypothetical protein